MRGQELLLAAPVEGGTLTRLVAIRVRFAGVSVSCLEITFNNEGTQSDSLLGEEKQIADLASFNVPVEPFMVTQR